MRQLTNIFRRVYRIFAHAWFQHREMFWQVEGRTGLYIFFKTVCDVYGLIPEDNYTIPPEAEGGEAAAEEAETRPSILKKNNEEERHSDTSGNEAGQASTEQSKALAVGNVTISTGHTTKRHRQTPSVDAGAISTVIEEIEEDDPKGEKEKPTPEEKPIETGKEKSTETEREREETRVVNPHNPEPKIEVTEEPLLKGPPEEEVIPKETTAAIPLVEPAPTSVIDPENEAKPEEPKTKDFEPEDSVNSEESVKIEEPAEADRIDDTQLREERAKTEVTDFASKPETPATEDTPKETEVPQSKSDNKVKEPEVSKS
jgi:hypothetical protein